MSNTETKPTALGGMGPKEAKKEITGYTKTSLRTAASSQI